MSETILISQLVIPSDDVALRPAPKETDKDYFKQIELESSIEKNGLLNTFSVRKDGDDYIVIDGSRRATALLSLLDSGRLPEDYFPGGTVSVNVREGNEFDMMADMIRGNYHSKKTLTTHEIRQISRIAMGKGWSLEETAEYIGLSPKYIGRLFKLLELPVPVQEAIDNGDMSLINAHTLNKLPAHLMEEHLEEAITMKSDAFAEVVQTALTEWKKEKQGSTEHKAEFAPSAKYMKKDEASEILQQAEVTYEVDPSDYNKGVLDALRKVFRLDEASVEAARAEYEAKQREREQKAEERKAKREEKKVAEAQKLLKEVGIIQ